MYAYYLKHTPSEAEHPGFHEIMASQSEDGEQVVREIILSDHYSSPVVVHKQMTHHLIDLDRHFLHQCRNVMLIRDPRAILASYNKVIQGATPYDIGLPQQEDLYAYLSQHGILNAIVDTSILLQNPADILEQLCHRLGIPFTEAMLSWSAGARPEDGTWAPYWYHNVHQSTGFKPYQPKTIALPPHLEELAGQCRLAYEQLLQDEHCLHLRQGL